MPGINRETSTKLGNKKWALLGSMVILETAMVVKHVGLGNFAEDQTFDASGTMKYDYPRGAIGFIEKVEHDHFFWTLRTMHQTQRLHNIKAKFKEANLSKVADARARTPTHSTFMELALCRKKARCEDVPTFLRLLD